MSTNNNNLSNSTSSDSTLNLEDLRTNIQSLDANIVDLLNKRALVSQQIGLAKTSLANTSTSSSSQIDYFIPSQEKNVIQRITTLNRGPLSNLSVEAIYREIISASISIQQEKAIVIGYLGPNSSLEHQIAKKRFGNSLSYLCFNSVREIFEAIECKNITYGLVLFESSMYGIDMETIDMFEEFKGVKMFKQCDEWLSKNIPKAERVHVTSSSKAAELASNEMYTAALCGEAEANKYDLPIINETNIIDNVSVNYMRYFVIARNIDDNIVSLKNNNNNTANNTNKTILSFKVDHRQPGALCLLLNSFKEINLTKIDTRPSPKHLRLFNYVFYVEFEGYYKSPSISKAIENAKQYCSDLRVIGSYVSELPNDLI